MKVLENVTLGRGQKDFLTRASELLEQVGLPDHIYQWSSVLSGGQKQRVALARALVTRPSLLLFDEPLGALDALTRIEMQDLLERLWLKERFTALLITHDVEEAIALADSVVLIENGLVTFELPIDLPRPRERDSAAFNSLRHEVLMRIKNRALPPHTANL
jgi:sulfonate transport system ATP-binding protein